MSDETRNPPGGRRSERCCDEGATCGPGVNRRDFVKVLGLGLGVPAGASAAQPGGPPDAASPLEPAVREALADTRWPSLLAYDERHLPRIALPVGGLGTGTVSLGGRGDLRDWEIMNRPAKGFVPASGGVAPFLALYARPAGAEAVCRLLEGPLEVDAFEGSHGSPVVTSNLPRFRHAAFAAAYPFGRVLLSDPDVPLGVHLRVFNPFVPGDAEASGIPLAALAVDLHNAGAGPVTASVVMSLPNFVGVDGSITEAQWNGDLVPAGARRNRNEARQADGLHGVVLSSEGVAPEAAAWGTIALATTATKGSRCARHG